MLKFLKILLIKYYANLELKCPYLMISNGLNHYFCKMNFEENQISLVKELPDYKTSL